MSAVISTLSPCVCKRLGKPAPKKSKMTRYTGKIMVTTFWNWKGILLREYHPIPLKTPSSRHWKHYHLVFTASPRSYMTRSSSLCHTILGHIRRAESRINLRVSVGKFLNISLIFWVWLRVISFSFLSQRNHSVDPGSPCRSKTLSICSSINNQLNSSQRHPWSCQTLF